VTIAPSDALRWEVAAFDALPDYPSSTPAGINGDQSHFGANTYHIGISELPNKGGYTNRTWEDKMPAAGSSWHSSATDESMSTADMVKNWNRHLAVFNDPTDPRRAYLAEYIGWNGIGSAERLDFQAGTRTSASADHKWHRHRAKRRRFYNSMTAAHACISIDKGETKQQYLTSIGQGGSTPPAPPSTSRKDDDMYMIEANSNDAQGNAQKVVVLVGSDGNVVGPVLYNDLKGRQDTLNLWSRLCGNASDNVGAAAWNDTMEALGIDGWRYDEQFVLQVPEA
jgi:hypothetical protein